jgi:hypothetical protein
MQQHLNTQLVDSREFCTDFSKPLWTIGSYGILTNPNKIAYTGLHRSNLDTIFFKIITKHFLH